MTNHTTASDALAVARLAALTDGGYDRVRQPEAAALGWRVETLDREVRQARAAAKTAEDIDHDRPPEFSDETIALRFAERHQDHLRFVAAWGRWMIREPDRWRHDKTMKAFDLAREVCRGAASACGDPRVSPALASAKTVAAIEKLSRADRRLAATVEQWDAYPWLLNTPGGVVDLRDGKTHPHRPDDYMTKITAVAPGGDCPLWHHFLQDITAANGELIDYLQRVVGYCLTGITREHAMFFGYGTGRNGKGTFINTLAGIMGDYATIAAMETFTASKNDRHPTELAMLRGARLVVAQETEEGRHWAETRIKAMTGGDPITARFTHQDFFTYAPEFKPFLFGNHKPGLRCVDEAMRARLNLIPFTVTIPAEERDKDLTEKLKAEGPGILAWAIEGCLHWQRIGLKPPAIVVSATDDYLGAEDSLGAWIAERCKEIGYGGTECSALYADWQTWAKAAGEDPGSQKRFSQALEAKGYRKEPKAKRSTFLGIALDVPPPRSEPAGDRV